MGYRYHKLTVAPKKLWSGKSRLARRFFSKRRSKYLTWALTIRPGDYIGTCMGYNCQVKEITYGWANEGWWSRGKVNKTWFLEEVAFTDINGGWHSGSGCSFPKETNEEITNFFKGYIESSRQDMKNYRESGWHDEELDDKILATIYSGQPIVNESGYLLDDFKKKSGL